MEIKASKTREGVLLSGALPPELSEASTLEIYPLRDGIYLLSAKGALGREAQQKRAIEKGELKMSEREKELVRKLLSVRFENRIPSEVNKTLSKEEKEILSVLIGKNLVHIFHGPKYGKDGVYNIADFAFSHVRENRPVSPSPLAKASPPAAPRVSSPPHLQKHGWMVLEGENEARAFAGEFPLLVKSGSVLGTRAFDRKFYFITKEYAAKNESKVLLSLSKGDGTSEEIARETGMENEGCRALLMHLCEMGEVMEKQKGKYAKA